MNDGALKKLLFIGYGNPGRLDDGLGPALAARLEESPFAGMTVDSNYQLSVEDAAAVAEHEIVVFADASLDGSEPFELKEIFPRPELSHTTHVIAPEAVLALAEEVFGRSPRAFLLSIRGYEFDEFGERLSDRAKDNLEAARKYLVEWIKTGMNHNWPG